MTNGLRGLGALALVLAFGCGGEEAAPPKQRSMVREKPAAEQADAGNRAPVIERVQLTPRAPSVRDEIEADVRTSDADDDSVTLTYAWTVNGRAAGSGPTLGAGAAQREDEVELTVVAHDGVADSEPMRASTEIVAVGPSIASITFDPAQGVKPGDVVTALVDVENEDDARLELTYRWLVNDVTVAEKGSRLATSGLRLGDKVQVEVMARDGDQASELARSGVLVIANTPPKIKGVPSAVQDGDSFRYQFEAEDPDGDRSLRFSLSEAPAGMTIDPISGLATWRPAKEQAGDHTIEVTVRDGAGAASALRFTVGVKAAEEPRAPAEGEGAAPAKAAPPAKAAEPAADALKFSDDEEAEAEPAPEAKELRFSDED